MYLSLLTQRFGGQKRVGIYGILARRIGLDGVFDFLHVYRAGLSVGVFYLMGLGYKKERGSGMLDWDIANGNDYNLNCVNQN